MIRDILLTKEIDVLLLDLELATCKYLEVKSILKTFPKLRLSFTVVFSEQIYAPNAIKAGVSGYVIKEKARNAWSIHY
jgi:DNA-binding NarL/FixJ family response regulator